MPFSVINTDFIKLDSFLKFEGLVGTGGEAKCAVSQGLVSVNGQICIQRGKKLFAGDKVSFNGNVYEIKRA